MARNKNHTNNPARDPQLERQPGPSPDPDRVFPIHRNSSITQVPPSSDQLNLKHLHAGRSQSRKHKQARLLVLPNLRKLSLLLLVLRSDHNLNRHRELLHEELLFQAILRINQQRLPSLYRQYNVFAFFVNTIRRICL